MIKLSKREEFCCPLRGLYSYRPLLLHPFFGESSIWGKIMSIKSSLQVHRRARAKNIACKETTMTTIPITPKVAAKRVAVVEEKPARRSSKAPPITPMKIAVCTMGRREEKRYEAPLPAASNVIPGSDIAEMTTPGRSYQNNCHQEKNQHKT